MTRYGFAPQEIWVLHGAICGARRRRLLQPPPFKSIVADLMASARIEKVGRQCAPYGQLAQRCTVVLTVDSEKLDMFFNSASGYRAQYLLCREQGHRANRFVLDTATPKVLSELVGRHLESAFVASSLTHDWAKVWVHQGLWLRRARREHRVLLVPSWQQELSSRDKERRKLALWGALAPSTESRILLKGGYVSSTEKLCIGKPPTQRASEIQELGFT
jgi:hypothetical protein